jgi:hypothetical protein
VLRLEIDFGCGHFGNALIAEIEMPAGDAERNQDRHDEGRPVGHTHEWRITLQHRPIQSFRCPLFPSALRGLHFRI